MLLRLVSLGLVQAAVDPKRPDQLLLDTRILEQYLKRYGPRVTTATGELGVAASQGEIWTPESRRQLPRRSGRRAPRLRRREPRKNRSSSSRASNAPWTLTRRSALAGRAGSWLNRLRPAVTTQPIILDFIFAIRRPDTARRRKI